MKIIATSVGLPTSFVNVRRENMFDLIGIDFWGIWFFFEDTCSSIGVEDILVEIIIW